MKHATNHTQQRWQQVEKMNREKRNHIEILNEIDILLKDNGFENEQNLLKSEISGSSTGGEICMKCGSILLQLIQQKKIEKVIGNQIIEFIDYCHLNGLYPEPKKTTEL